MKTVLGVLLVASQMAYYESKVPSFGCTSIDALSQLQRVRSNAQDFRKALTEKQLYGECVEILEGTLVEGAIESSDSSVLRVNMQSDPPGFEAPLADFEIKPTDSR